MEALIVVAHGSKVESSNNEIKRIVDKIKENLKDEQLDVFYAFLELC